MKCPNCGAEFTPGEEGQQSCARCRLEAGLGDGPAVPAALARLPWFEELHARAQRAAAVRKESSAVLGATLAALRQSRRQATVAGPTPPSQTELKRAPRPVPARRRRGFEELHTLAERALAHTRLPAELRVRAERALAAGLRLGYDLRTTLQQRFASRSNSAETEAKE